MKQNIKQPYEIIHIDKQTGTIKTPSLLLMNRSFRKIGKINNFDNWNISLSANAADEISFDVHKYCNGRPCTVWNELMDLKIVEVIGFGRFEISVDCTDNTETVKSVHGISLETELAQVMLHNFHVNDEDAVDPSSENNYDADGNYIPTTFYREISDHDSENNKKFKREHSLLHRVLAAAPHWGIGYVTPYIALDEESEPEESENFQRTYTADGESIYDFLTGTVAEESNVVFIFDTLNRLVHCYSLCDCIDQKTGAPKTDKYGNKVTSIGCDTSVFVSKNRLANEITISSSNNSNEITITPSGILCKRMDDEGFYGDKQLRITGNIMAFTDDNWKSVKMAIGETLIDDPTAPEGMPKTPAYGIIAENIVGKFIASEKAYIGNESGSVLIDKDGIDIKDGSITLSNGEYTIELDPNHRQSKTGNNAPNREQSNIQNDYLFCIRDASDEKNVIMGVDTNGAGYFSGNIKAANITGGVINIKDKFIVDPEGNVSLPKGTTLSWDDIKNTEDILTKDNFSSIITKDYISSLKATAGSILSQNGGYKTSINAGQISSTYYNLIDNAAENSNLLPGIGKLNAEQTDITNSVILLDNQTKIKKPLFIAGGADSVSSYPRAALYANGRIYSSEEVCPSKDSSFSCGHPDYKWSVVYAKSGAINTSDRNQKHDIQSIAEIYEKLFFRLKPVNFMFDNGDRIHTGIIAQDLKESMDELGLSATEVAAFCRDKKTKIGKDEQTEEVIEVPDLDENGSPRYNYGVRYSEFIMLNTHMIQKLYKEKEEMKKEIDSLKESVTHLHDKIETRIQGIN